jgi:hypothetical protein
MKAFFLLAIAAGFAGTLAGAHYLPWAAHTRLPSQTSVVANGGRAEEFIVRLPADRIAATDGRAGGLRAAQSQGVMQVPAQFVDAPLLVEHFKVRDSAGNVIGIAARHWTETAGGPSAGWVIVIPSRGSLLLASRGEAQGALDAALRQTGYTGAVWSGEARLSLGGPYMSSVRGSGEFEGLTGSYAETWVITGVDDTGELRGTISLDTTTGHAQ